MSASSLRHRWPNPGRSAARESVRRRRGWLGLGAALLAALLAVGCGQAPAVRSDKKVEVVVTTPITAEVLDYQDFTGRVDAFRTVDMRARVAGYLGRAPFKEGDRVKAGDVLFEIDSRTYKADLVQAEANLKLAVADRQLQETNSLRARRLLGSRAMGKEEYDQIMAARMKAEATVGSMEAARDRAAVNLGYCQVIAPISGRISRRNVDPGNLVRADDTLLTTIVAEDPAYVYFDVDERTYLNLTGQTASTGALAAVKLPVLMRLANEQDYPEPGTIDFLDNRLNGNTGTIRMRAVFPNHQGILKSGLFGRVRLPIGSAYQALMVPAQALVSDQDRKYVYVVDSENKVEYRSVKIGQAIAGLRVIQEPRRGKDGKVLRDQDGRIVEGLLPGERVIISGIQRVRPQLEVKAEMRKPPEPPESPLRKLLTQSQAKVQDQPGTAEPVPSPPARRAAGPGATGHGRGHGKR